MSSSTENELMQVTPPDIQSSNFHTDFHSDSESFHNSVCEALPTQDPSSSHDIANKSENLEDLLKNLRNQKTSQHCKNLIGSICASYPHCLQEAEGEARGLPLLVHTAAFCDALVKENEHLKNHLKNIQQDIDALRDENKSLKRDQTNVSNAIKQSKDKHGSNSNEDTLEETVVKLQARIKNLESQRAEVLRVNKQWDVQYRKLKLGFDQLKSSHHERDASVTSQRNDSTPASSTSDAKMTHEQKKRQDADILLISAKKEIRQLMMEKSQIARNFANAHTKCQSLKREIAHLKEVKRSLESDKGCLEAENQRLNLALEAAYSIHHQRPSLPSEPHSSGDPMHLTYGSVQCNSPPEEATPPVIREEAISGADQTMLEDLRTQVLVLQQQVKIYREDFETERRDRERSQNEKQRLDEMLTQAQHEVEALTQQVRTHEFDFQQEKREKERLKRHLQRYQSSSGISSSRTRHRAGPGNAFTTGRSRDPPDYFAHRYNGNDDILIPASSSGSRRRRQSQLPLYNDVRGNQQQEWLFTDNHLDLDPIPSYPPGDVLD